MLAESADAHRWGIMRRPSDSLKELQHEVAVYEHLRGEQGVSVPRFVACGYIVDSTLYFLATELLGPSLESAGDDLEPAALHALQRIHACGVLHR